MAVFKTPYLPSSECWWVCTNGSQENLPQIAMATSAHWDGVISTSALSYTIFLQAKILYDRIGNGYKMNVMAFKWQWWVIALLQALQLIGWLRHAT